MAGRDGNIHRGDLSRQSLPMISHLGAMVSTVNGWLLADRLQGMTATMTVGSESSSAYR